MLTAVNIFNDALHKSVIDFVPQCSFYESTYPPWFNKELKRILYLKKEAHTKFKSTSNIFHYKEFSYLRAKFKYTSKK
jgi:hypothetical protein